MKLASCWDDLSARQQALDTIWPELEKIPIDTAIAEPAALQGKVAVVPATFGLSLSSEYPRALLTRFPSGWDDVGDFSSLADLLPAEANQPRILGDSRYGTSTKPI
jgi:mannose-1-phosphate guanylyltransferase